jgi:hypothetical protein
MCAFYVVIELCSAVYIRIKALNNAITKQLMSNTIVIHHNNHVKMTHYCASSGLTASGEVEISILKVPDAAKPIALGGIHAY